jgi:hypothetical protein
MSGDEQEGLVPLYQISIISCGQHDTAQEALECPNRLVVDAKLVLRRPWEVMSQVRAALGKGAVVVMVSENALEHATANAMLDQHALGRRATLH